MCVTSLFLMCCLLAENASGFGLLPALSEVLFLMASNSGSYTNSKQSSDADKAS